MVACTLCEQEKDSLISTLMRYMLFKQSATAGLVKREELTKLVGEKYPKGNRNLPTHIILHAQIKFPQLFGMELREIEKAKKYVQPGQKKPPATAIPKLFVLRSLVPAYLRTKFVDQPEGAPQKAFTLLVVSLTYLAGEYIEEDTLWGHLRDLGVTKDERHPIFGEAENEIKRMLIQRYLQKGTLTSPEGERTFYQLAENAVDEFPKQVLESYMSSVMVREDDDDDDDDGVNGAEK